MQAKRRQRSETRRRRRGWDTGWRRRWDYVSLFFHYGVIGEDCGLSRLESGLAGGTLSPSCCCCWALPGSRKEFGATFGLPAGVGIFPVPPRHPFRATLLPSALYGFPHGDRLPRCSWPRSGTVSLAFPPGVTRDIRRVPETVPGAAQPPAGHGDSQILVSEAGGEGGAGSDPRVASGSDRGIFGKEASGGS